MRKPLHIIETKDAFYERTVVYNGPYTAHVLAKRSNAVAKHAAMKGSHPALDTMSVVVTPSDRNHLRP